MLLIVPGSSIGKLPKKKIKLKKLSQNMGYDGGPIFGCPIFPPKPHRIPKKNSEPCVSGDTDQ
jgi:hypothetical protein